MDYLVEKSNDQLRIKGDFEKDIVVDISRKDVLDEHEIEEFLVNILSEKEGIDDFIFLDKGRFLEYEKEEYIYLDFEFPSSMLANSEEALFPFVEKIKVLEEEKLTGHLIMELVGADISLLRAGDIAGMIEKKMEEVLENRGSVAEPTIDFGLNVASIENRKGESKARLLFFIGRFTD